jgi:hypothetical protein
VITSTVIRSPAWLPKPLRNMCATDDYEYVPFVIIAVLSSFINYRSFDKITRVSLADLELLTILLPGSSGVLYCRLLFLFCPFSFGHCIACTWLLRLLITIKYLQTFLAAASNELLSVVINVSIQGKLSSHIFYKLFYWWQ